MQNPRTGGHAPVSDGGSHIGNDWTQSAYAYLHLGALRCPPWHEQEGQRCNSIFLGGTQRSCASIEVCAYMLMTAS